MPLYAIDDLQTGMVLSKDIKDRSGRTLLTAEMALQEKHLKILKTWGISFVEVHGDDAETDLQEIIAQHPELEEQTQEVAAVLFQHVNKDDKFFTALIPVWKKFHLRELASKL